MLCLRMHSNVILWLMVQELQDPTLCSSTVKRHFTYFSRFSWFSFLLILEGIPSNHYLRFVCRSADWSWHEEEDGCESGNTIYSVFSTGVIVCPGKPMTLGWINTTFFHILLFNSLNFATYVSLSQTFYQTLSRKERTFSLQPQSLDEVVQPEMYFLH